MTGDRLDLAFDRARSGDVEAFAEWMGMIEIPLRRSLSRWARAVDVEVVIQETFLRMWLASRDEGRIFEGDHASLKFAVRVARNVALEEVRRWRQDRFLGLDSLDALPEGRIEPDPPDPALARLMRECMQRLPAKPASALSARIRSGNRSDRELAESLRMSVNTFLQNIVRARRFLRDCLQRRGVRLGEVRS